MVTIEIDEQNIDKMVHRSCSPLFATDQFGVRGHNPKSTNATVTYVKFSNRIYALTCHHVLEALHAEARRSSHRIVPSVHTADRKIWQFGSYTAEGKYRWTFTSCRDFASEVMLEAAETAKGLGHSDPLEQFRKRNSNFPDIAIADLTAHWESFRSDRALEPFDLDKWNEDDWSITQPVWLAYGFPNNHKFEKGNMVSAPMPRISISLATPPPSEDKPHFTLFHAFEKDHIWGFSGMSGGPALVAHASEEKFGFVGLVFEGVPAHADEAGTSESYVGQSDILIRGYYITPNIFSQWLAQLKHGVEFA